MPQLMRAAVVHAFGQPLEIEEVPVPEVPPGRILVKVDDFGDVTRPTETYALPWPIPSRLRPLRSGDPDGRTLTR